MDNIKLIAIDLDGTLLHDNHEFSDYSRAVWKRVIDRGIHIMPVTGRPFNSMTQRIALDLCEYTINSNGVHIFEVGNNEPTIVWDKSVRWDLARRTIDFITQKYPQVVIQAYVDQNLYALSENERTAEYTNRSGIRHNFISSWDEIEGEQIVKIMALEEHENLVPLCDDFADSQELNAVFSNPKYLEIFNIHASKGKSILYLAKKLEIDASHILGFGDSYNDLSMLEVCGHAYVMQNAWEHLAPNLPRTKYSNNEDGVMKHIEEMLGI